MNKVMRNVWLALLAIGVVILLPLYLPVVCVLHGVYLRRLHAAADRFKCAACGQILGGKSIQLADAEWAERMRERGNQFPGVKPRVTRDIHAICPRCGTCYRFDEKTRDFAEVSDR